MAKTTITLGEARQAFDALHQVRRSLSVPVALAVQINLWRHALESYALVYDQENKEILDEHGSWIETPNTTKRWKPFTPEDDQYRENKEQELREQEVTVGLRPLDFDALSGAKGDVLPVFIEWLLPITNWKGE